MPRAYRGACQVRSEAATVRKVRLPPKESPWYLVWVAVTTAIVMIVFYLIFNSGDIDWLIVAIMPIAAVVGVLIGNRISRNRRDAR